MSDQQENWTNGSGELGLDNNGEINTGHDRKRTRSSDSDSSRSTDSSETQQKKVKVAVRLIFCIFMFVVSFVDFNLLSSQETHQ